LLSADSKEKAEHDAIALAQRSWRTSGQLSYFAGGFVNVLGRLVAGLLNKGPMNFRLLILSVLLCACHDRPKLKAEAKALQAEMDAMKPEIEELRTSVDSLTQHWADGAPVEDSMDLERKEETLLNKKDSVAAAEKLATEAELRLADWKKAFTK
jgi:hypothetical protein